MIQIRSNIFETNSSSIHSLCIDTENYFMNKKDKKYFEEWRKEARPVIIKGANYGRCPSAPLYRLEDKANYLWTAIINKYVRIDREYNTFVEEKNKKRFKWWQNEILKALPRNSQLIIPKTWDDYPDIDHSSNLDNFLIECEKKSPIIRCLLDDGSFIDISGDEYPNFVFAFLPCNFNQLIKMPGRYMVYIKGN